MRTMVTIAILAAICSTAAAAFVQPELAKPLPRSEHVRPKYVFEKGELMATITPRGTTKYEYSGDNVSKKTFPNGVTVDYFYDREGKATETRFSNGLVRRYVYDRKGNLSQIVGSNGYTLTLGYPTSDSEPTPTLVVTGPKNTLHDLTPKLKAIKTSRMMAVASGKLKQLGTSTLVGQSGFCGGSNYQKDDCDWGGHYDYDDEDDDGEADDGHNGSGSPPSGGGEGDGGGGSGGGNAGGEGQGGGDWGNTDPFGDGGDWGGEWGGENLPRDGEFGDRRADERMSFERCMTMICDPADKRFHRWCDENAKDKYACHAAADREYWECEKSCR